jgi:hypothetical protein
MESNRIANTVHRNHLKLDLALEYDPTGAAQCMEAVVRRAVRDMAARIAPRLKAADDIAFLEAKESIASAAHAQTKRSVKRLRSAVVATFEEVPAELERLRGMQLGASPAENVLILRVLVDTLRTMPGFVFPPGLDAAAVDNVIHAHEVAFADWAAAKQRAADAASALIVMRPEVVRLWEEYGLKAWIKAHVRQTGEQQKWGMPAKRRTRKAAEEDVVEESTVTVTSTQPSTGIAAGNSNSTSTPKTLEGNTALTGGMGLLSVGPGVTPPVVKNGVNGTNGHDRGATI